MTYVNAALTTPQDDVVDDQEQTAELVAHDPATAVLAALEQGAEAHMAAARPKKTTASYAGDCTSAHAHRPGAVQASRPVDQHPAVRRRRA